MQRTPLPVDPDSNDDAFRVRVDYFPRIAVTAPTRGIRGRRD